MAISINDITSEGTSETGLFERLMDSIETRILTQFNAGRIKGTDYATVYLGAMQTALTQAIGFTLQKDQASNQADLIEEQIRASQINTGLATDQSVASVSKTNREIDLLVQRKKTEQAQILDVIDGIAVAGSVGKEKALHQAQIDTYQRDAEQKLLKILMDAWNVTKTVSGASLPTPDGASNEDIEEVIVKARAGIGITTPVVQQNSNVLSADAGSDQTVNSAASVGLDASGSTYVQSYYWTQLAGSTVTLSSELDPAPTFTAPTIAAPNTEALVFQVEVTGFDTSRDTDTVTVLVTGT